MFLALCGDGDGKICLDELYRDGGKGKGNFIEVYRSRLTGGSKPNQADGGGSKPRVVLAI